MKAPEGHYCPTTKTRLALATRTSTPGEFLIVFDDAVREYQYHKFAVIWQTHHEQELQTVVGPPKQRKIIVGMDFAENYIIEYKVEIQSEYWVSIQLTLFIVVGHYRVAAEDGGFELLSEAYVVVSSDLRHDTYFVCPIWQAISGPVDWCSTSGTSTQMVQRLTSRTGPLFSTRST